MALAAVVNLVAATKSVSVAAYARAAGAVHGVQASSRRYQISRTTAATPERKAETCAVENAATLIAAPPVENSTAAASAAKRADFVMSSQVKHGSPDFRLFRAYRLMSAWARASLTGRRAPPDASPGK